MTDKYCVDCKHSEVVNRSENAPFLGVWRWKEMKCARNAPKDPVYGETIKDGLLCCHAEREDALRLEQFRCGKDAKYWEAK